MAKIYNCKQEISYFAIGMGGGAAAVLIAGTIAIILKMITG